MVEESGLIVTYIPPEWGELLKEKSIYEVANDRGYVCISEVFDGIQVFALTDSVSLADKKEEIRKLLKNEKYGIYTNNTPHVCYVLPPYNSMSFEEIFFGTFEEGEEQENQLTAKPLPSEWKDILKKKKNIYKVGEFLNYTVLSAVFDGIQVFALTDNVDLTDDSLNDKENIKKYDEKEEIRKLLKKKEYNLYIHNGYLYVLPNYPTNGKSFEEIFFG